MLRCFPGAETSHLGELMRDTPASTRTACPVWKRYYKALDTTPPITKLIAAGADGEPSAAA